MKNGKANVGLIIIIVIFAVLAIAAPFVSGQNPLTPKVLKSTWASDTVSLTFSGREKVSVVCGDTKVEGTYVNGTTGTTLVIWFELGENCPEELQFLESTREDFLPYSYGEDETGEYMLIDNVKYYKQG